MSRIIHKVLIVAFFMLLALGVGSCVEPIDPSLRPDAPRLTFWIYVPGSMQQPATKALQGDVSSVSPESQLHDIQVWAFRHGASDDDQILSYVDVSGINWSHSGTTPRSWDDCYELSMSIPQDFLLEADPRIDFYILANWRSVFTNKPGQTKLKDVRDMVFGANNGVGYFGTSTVTTSVPAKGLPISTIYKGEEGNGVSIKFLKDAIANNTTIDDALFKNNLQVIELKRAVSKLRFVFSRPEGLSNVSIISVEVSEGTIPNSIWAFERQTPRVPGGTTYNTAVAQVGSATNPLLTDSQIGEIEDPETLTSTWFETNQPTGYAQSAQGYDDYLRAAIDYKESGTAKPKATEVITYFRESDEAIKGKITYKLSANQTTPYEATFDMGTVSDDNNFYRNHYWTVYAYFLHGNLYVKPVVADWIDATEDPLAYTLKMNTNMRLFDSWLYRYDTVDQDYTNWTNWAGSHMVVSDGREAKPANAPEEFVAGRPLRSPQIQLVTTGVADDSVAGSGTFELKIDNNDFEIIRAKKTNGVVSSYEESANGVLTIPAGDDVYTYFYIVPKDNVTPSNPVAKVSLIYHDPVLGPQKVTFNSNTLPGYSDDSSEIWAYYVNPGDYKYIIDNVEGQEKPRYLKMYYKDYNNPLVPTPVQN